jgi:hypothetical protein
MRVPTFNSGPQSGPLPQHMLLPDQLVESSRTHPHRQRRIGSYGFSRAFLVAPKQAV